MNRKFLWLAAPVLAAAALTAGLLLTPKTEKSPVLPTTEAATEGITAPTGEATVLPTAQAATQPTEATVENTQEASVNLGYGLQLTQVGSYTGPYVEDGSDEILSGILMLRVTNSGASAIEYGRITLPVDQGQAEFTLTGLLPGETVILLEQNRLPWSSSEQYLYPLLTDVALYQQPLSLQEDRLSLQLLSGGLNMRNISDAPIEGDIVIYYKNKQQGVFYGGITYRLRFTGGLDAGETAQLMSDHLHGEGTELLFITVG